ncbi:MAG TPA: type II toxin-antitoxin system VapC family toxin [Vicinamibacterales bacterium]|nr:type II toxin-antitoxin system VapC family toxin [Vicinamibacterales bacterium]
MIRAFVADASVAVAWVHPAQASADTAALLDAMAEGAVLDVPALWPLEVANALTVLVRRRKLASEERETALTWLRGLPLRVDHDGVALAFSRLAELAVTYQLSVYDAAYLELAQRRNVPLACADGPLRKAAARAGVALWP